MNIISLNTGTSFDTFPEQEIVISLDNPMFQEDHLPTSISTTIEFPKTLRNKQEFSYIESLMELPQKKELPVSIMIAGIEIFTGILRFESVSEESLDYTFIGHNSEEFLSGFIYEIPSTPISAYPSSIQFLEDARSGRNPEVALPQLIRQTYITSMEYNRGDKYPRGHIVAPDYTHPWEPNKKGYPLGPDCSPNAKFANFLYTNAPSIIPVIRVGFLLGKIIPKVQISSQIRTYTDRLGIVAMAQCEASDPDTPTSMLPDMSNSEFVSNILRMFCATIYLDGTTYRMIPNQEVIAELPSLNWSDRISDTFSIGCDQEYTYSISYANEEDKDELREPGSIETDDTPLEIPQCESLTDLMGKIAQQEEFVPFKDPITGNIYSGKSFQARLRIVYDQFPNRRDAIFRTDTTTIPMIDIPSQAAIKSKTLGTEGRDTTEFANDITFHCIPCVPTIVAQYYDEHPDGTPKKTMIPMQSVSGIIDPKQAGGPRSKTAYIGLVFGINIIDQGNYFTQAIPDKSSGIEIRNPDYSIGITGPQGLYEKFHRHFAEWLVKKHSTLSIEIFLHPVEVAHLRLWQKIQIGNHLYFIKSIEFSISTKANIVLANADLIAL